MKWGKSWRTLTKRCTISLCLETVVELFVAVVSAPVTTDQKMTKSRFMHTCGCVSREWCHWNIRWWLVIRSVSRNRLLSLSHLKHKHLSKHFRINMIHGAAAWKSSLRYTYTHDTHTHSYTNRRGIGEVVVQKIKAVKILQQKQQNAI